MANMTRYVVFSFVFLLLFTLLITEGEGRMTLSTRNPAPPLPALVCDKIYGTQDGDTCFGIIKAFKLTTAAFNALNPNLNCDKIFVGEWLCLGGTTI